MRIVTRHTFRCFARWELSKLRRNQASALTGDLEAAAEIERLRINAYTVLAVRPEQKRHWRWAVIAA